ncbi:MAG TPA: hypothetical protein VFB60_08920 [Ktedonobacteraceae bacterium]|nr:hypothetical protein [Ktedonobacteraceae bacterium]
MMLFVKSAYTTAVSLYFKRVPSVLSVRTAFRHLALWHALAVALAAFWSLVALALVQLAPDLTLLAIGFVTLAILALFSGVILMLAYVYQQHR